MEIDERVRALALKIREQKASIATEEATKNAFVMPFINSVLRYDVFNPNEVVPEFTSDVGTKKGEKIDYALVRDGQVQILIEVKKISEPLRIEHASQLFRYFTVTSARIAVLTNGECYEFYTDLDAPNKMDAKPFLVLDMLNVDENLLPELDKLTRESFDLESVINAAGELKYIGQLKRIISAQFKQPEDTWVRFLTTRVYEGAYTQRVRDQFTPLVAKAARQFLTEQVNERLKTALSEPYGDPASMDSTENNGTSDGHTAESSTGNSQFGEQASEVTTTEEELEGYRIVRAIVCSEVSPGRVVARDSKSYFGIMLDDNNRKPIARLWFNRKKKYIGIFDENKVETRVAIDAVEEIYSYASQLRDTVNRYSTQQAQASGVDSGPADTLKLPTLPPNATDIDPAEVQLQRPDAESTM